MAVAKRINYSSPEGRYRLMHDEDRKLMNLCERLNISPSCALDILYLMNSPVYCDNYVTEIINLHKRERPPDIVTYCKDKEKYIKLQPKVIKEEIIIPEPVTKPVKLDNKNRPILSIKDRRIGDRRVTIRDDWEELKDDK
jgi:hypothetical protein